VAFATRVVGVTFAPGWPDSLYALEAAALKAELGLAGGAESIPALLRRNPANEIDPNAIEVHVPSIGHMIGHLPAQLAARIAPRMDSGRCYDAEVLEVLVHPDAPENPGISVRVSPVEHP
jgi:hypothetical protein